MKNCYLVLLAVMVFAACWVVDARWKEAQERASAEAFANRPLEIGDRVECYMEDGKRCLLEGSVDNTAVMEGIDPKPVNMPDGTQSKLAWIRWECKDEPNSGLNSHYFLHLLKRAK